MGWPTVSSSGDRRAIGRVSFAYMWWGSSAIFWSQLSSVSPIDQLSFRVATAFFYLIVGASLLHRRLADSNVEASLFTRGELRDHFTVRHIAYGAGAAIAIASNWALFLWAVSNGQAVEAAFGYFLMPILSVGLGVGLLGERLRRLQVLALVLSAIGIIWNVLVLGGLPWIAILVAVTFAAYGLFRKQGPWDAVSGLTFETGLVAPFAIVALTYRAFLGEPIFGDGSIATYVFIALTGVVTAIPLLAFASASRRVSLTVIGLLQYINPTLQFLVGWQVLGEEVSGARLAGFAWIWLALGLIVYDELKGDQSDLQRPVDRRAASSGQRLVGPRERLTAKEPTMRRER